MNKVRKFDAWFFGVLVIAYLISCVDYLSRSSDDFDKSKMNCGKLESANYSSTGIRGSGGLILKINSSDYPNEFRVARHALSLEKQFSIYVGKEICIRYVKSPLMEFLIYPIEIYDNKKIIVLKDVLLPQYLDRNGSYFFWFFILSTYFFFLLYKLRK